MADDHSAIRARLAALLSPVRGVERVTQTATVEATLEALALESYRVVVLDLHMPGQSTLDALPRIKSSKPAPLVIVLTHHAEPQLARESLARGADYFFDKAAEFERVVDVVAREALTELRAPRE